MSLSVKSMVQEGCASVSWKIMIVDDDAEWIKLLKLIAERFGHECIGTSHPLEALEMAREAKPDLIMLDDMMPDMDGFEVMRLLRADPAMHHVPIVFSSARETGYFKDVIIPENEPIGFLAKPFAPSDFRAMVNKYLTKE